MEADPEPHRGTLILALGLIGILSCPLAGIAAWVMGNRDLQEMGAGRMDPQGRRLTVAGKVCGILSLVLTFAVVLMLALLVAVVRFRLGSEALP